MSEQSVLWAGPIIFSIVITHISYVIFLNVYIVQVQNPIVSFSSLTEWCDIPDKASRAAKSWDAQIEGMLLVLSLELLFLPDVGDLEMTEFPMNILMVMVSRHDSFRQNIRERITITLPAICQMTAAQEALLLKASMINKDMDVFNSITIEKIKMKVWQQP